MSTIIEAFSPKGGQHCITNSLKQIFEYYGHPLSEEMLFGIGEGLDFLYINLAASPMVSGRVQIGAFEKTLSERLGIGMKVKQQKDYTKALLKTKQMLDAKKPVLCYVDMPYLSYFGFEEMNHFGGHSIVIFGYDDEQEVFYVSDRDNSDYPIRVPSGAIQEDYHLVPYSEIQTARSSNFKPFPANNKYVEFDFSNYDGPSKEMLCTSIQNVCQAMLNPPANLKGLNGIRKFSKEVRKWSKFTPEKLSQAGSTNYFMIHADGGTGGGIFRNMYGKFLCEAALIVGNQSLGNIGNELITLSDEWNVIADIMWTLYESSDPDILLKLSEKIELLYVKELELFMQLSSTIADVQL